MSHILPMTATELERRLYKVDDLSIHPANVSNNVIKVIVDHFIEDGSSIKFKAPVDCSAVTRIVEPVIDELDPIEESYCLQVASAGTVRPLDKDEHIRFACDNKLNAVIGLYVAVDGSKEYSGIIEEYDGEKLTIVNGNEKHTFDKKQISKINAEFETEIDLVENEEKEDE